jgi:hypothetical protein
MGDPITIQIDRTESGRFRATAPGLPQIGVESDTLDDLFRGLNLQLAPLVARSSTSAEVDVSGEGVRDDEDDARFERDLDYVLDKNAELYRRLAR